MNAMKKDATDGAIRKLPVASANPAPNKHQLPRSTSGAVDDSGWS